MQYGLGLAALLLSLFGMGGTSSALPTAKSKPPVVTAEESPTKSLVDVLVYFDALHATLDGQAAVEVFRDSMTVTLQGSLIDTASEASPQLSGDFSVVFTLPVDSGVWELARVEDQRLYGSSGAGYVHMLAWDGSTVVLQPLNGSLSEIVVFSETQPSPTTELALVGVIALLGAELPLVPCNPDFQWCWDHARDACSMLDCQVAQFNYSCNPETGATVCSWNCNPCQGGPPE